MDAVKILGSLLGGGSMSSNLGGQVIGGLLKGAMSGGTSAGSGGGLGDLLGAALGGAKSGGTAGGGLGDVLGAALGGGGGRSGGGLGAVLGTVAMGALAKYAAGQGGGMPDLGALLGGGSQQRAQLDTPAVHNEAEVLIEAMINAAKADGRIDAGEERAIFDRLGELDQDEMEFIRRKLQAPVDAAEFARRVPDSMRQQVYGASLLAVELDEQSEALYLRDLAQGLRLQSDECNAIHQQLGAPVIFR